MGIILNTRTRTLTRTRARIVITQIKAPKGSLHDTNRSTCVFFGFGVLGWRLVAEEVQSIGAPYRPYWVGNAEWLSLLADAEVFLDILLVFYRNIWGSGHNWVEIYGVEIYGVFFIFFHRES